MQIPANPADKQIPEEEFGKRTMRVRSESAKCNRRLVKSVARHVPINYQGSVDNRGNKKYKCFEIMPHNLVCPIPKRFA